MEGSGDSVTVPEGGGGTVTNSLKQTPKPGRTDAAEPQLAATQEPLRKTCVVDEHARQLPGPAPLHEEHDESHD
jgi:hypothetical protein